MKNSTETLITNEQLKSIVKGTLSNLTRSNKVQHHGDRSTIDESYVAEPKQFKQVSELLSQRSKDSHVTIYKDHIESFNDVSSKLDTASRGETNGMHGDYRSLKMDEAFNMNAVWLHELFFANCFDPHSEIVMDSMAFIRLQRVWSTFDDWQRDFIACAMSCGNGWVVCGYNMFLKQYVNTFISNNSQDVMLGLYPIVVIDCHEHAYVRDYASDRKSYVIAMMKELNWEVIDDRFKRAEAIVNSLK